jgi:hypothetical protein
VLGKYLAAGKKTPNKTKTRSLHLKVSPNCFVAGHIPFHLVPYQEQQANKNNLTIKSRFKATQTPTSVRILSPHACSAFLNFLHTAASLPAPLGAGTLRTDPSSVSHSDRFPFFSSLCNLPSKQQSFLGKTCSSPALLW